VSEAIVKTRKSREVPQASQRTRKARLGVRLTQAQEALIRRAAEVSRKSVTDFMLESACETAEQVLLDQRFFMLDADRWNAFLSALDRPPEAKRRLRELLSRPAPWED
jgi:uncharacterized protein (DUF1778 family)